MAAHQCPRCPLRFSFRTELEFHLREDHDPGQVGRVVSRAEALAETPLVLPDGRVPDSWMAAAVSASDESPHRRHEFGDPPRWSSYGAPVEDSVDEPSHAHPIGPRQPEIALMPRRVVVAVVGLVIVVLGLGLLFGS